MAASRCDRIITSLRSGEILITAGGSTPEVRTSSDPLSTLSIAALSPALTRQFTPPRVRGARRGT